MTPLPQVVLFLCARNSCRSQMAEGFARVLAPPGTVVLSAGSQPGKLDPVAVKVMAELNVDIAEQFSKGLAEVSAEKADTVVTLCNVFARSAGRTAGLKAGRLAGLSGKNTDESEASCPSVPLNAQRFHWPIENPSTRSGSEDERLRAYRSARNRILKLVCELFDPARPE